VLSGYGRPSNPLPRIPTTNAPHSLAVNTSTVPPGSFESRTPTTPSTSATSTHCPPLPPLLLTVAHLLIARPGRAILISAMELLDDPNTTEGGEEDTLRWLEAELRDVWARSDGSSLNGKHRGLEQHRDSLLQETAPDLTGCRATHSLLGRCVFE
jgi:hypothetical protein